MFFAFLFCLFNGFSDVVNNIVAHLLFTEQ